MQGEERERSPGREGAEGTSAGEESGAGAKRVQPAIALFYLHAQYLQINVDICVSPRAGMVAGAGEESTKDEKNVKEKADLSGGSKRKISTSNNKKLVLECKKKMSTLCRHYHCTIKKPLRQVKNKI